MFGVFVSAGKKINACKVFFLRIVKEEERLKDISVSDSIILKWILKKWNAKP